MNESRIALLRRERGWTQERLAAESTVAVRTIQRLESGREASLESLSLIATALQVPVAELFTSSARDAFEPPVPGEHDRQVEQQSRRDAITGAWRRAFFGLTVIVTLLVVALVGSGRIPELGIFIVPAFWVGARVGSTLLLRLVLDRQLDARYPLSTPTSRSRARSSHV